MMDCACGTRMCASSASALWILCGSLRRILHIVHYYSLHCKTSCANPWSFSTQAPDLLYFMAILFPNSDSSRFYPPFKNRKDPDRGPLLLLGGYVRASYHGVSQQQKMHIATARSCGLRPINCYDYATAPSCFCIPLWGNLSEALNHVS